MNKNVQSLLNIIDRGMQGLNKGLEMGLPKLEAVIDGIQRQTYTVICGSTGSGKTTFCLYSYVYRPIADNLGDPRFKVLYISLEMTAEILLAKILSLHLYEEYGIELSYKQLMSRQEILSKEARDIVEKASEWLSAFCDQLIIYDKPTTSDGLKFIIEEYAEKNGTFEETDERITYKSKVEDETVLIAVDHLALLTLMPGQTRKSSMDEASNHLMRFRNMCAYSPLVLLQLNRASSSMDRRKASMQEIELSDIKDSGNMAQDFICHINNLFSLQYIIIIFTNKVNI